MKLLLVAAAVLAVASCARMSLEDMEFHAWKLKFCELVVTLNDCKSADKTPALAYFPCCRAGKMSRSTALDIWRMKEK